MKRQAKTPEEHQEVHDHLKQAVVPGIHEGITGDHDKTQAPENVDNGIVLPDQCDQENENHVYKDQESGLKVIRHEIKN
jgi:hypothetical protein